MAFLNAFRNRRVLVTGDTGFKGSWLSEWLILLGAHVHGFALPEQGENLFSVCKLRNRIKHLDGDVRDAKSLKTLIEEVQPDFVFHLAAQALVRPSYQDPSGTFATNVMGVAHVLDALRVANRPCTAIIVTSDKCYENREWIHGYREQDPLGGHDPYSASKGAAEIVTASFRNSFFSLGHPVAIASARAGNVIGGGDWSQDRIVPDCIRALRESRPIQVRNPASTRPWQHVLEPLSGYLWLAAKIDQGLRAGKDFDSRLLGAFNFGPELASNRSVGDLVGEILKHWPGSWETPQSQAAVHEAGLLSLSIDKAARVLGWSPVWNFETCVARTITMYQEIALGHKNAPAEIESQILEYSEQAGKAGLPWAK